MQQKVFLDPGYIPLIQKPTCCAVTCLQMILYRNGFGLHDQEELAVAFGVKIREKYAAAFSSKMPIMTRSNFDEGIPTVESESKINAFFVEKKVGLIAKSYVFSEIPSVRDFIKSHIRENSDVWIEYHAQDIHPDDQMQGNYIHDGLVESIDLADDMVCVIDSMPDHRQRLTLPLKTLERAISPHFGKETGFVIVRKA